MLVFSNERGRPMRRQRVHEIVKRAAGTLAINVHSHTLRHSTGYALVKAGMHIEMTCPREFRRALRGETYDKYAIHGNNP